MTQKGTPHGTITGDVDLVDVVRPPKLGEAAVVDGFRRQGRFLLEVAVETAG